MTFWIYPENNLAAGPSHQRICGLLAVLHVGGIMHSVSQSSVEMYHGVAAANLQQQKWTKTGDLRPCGKCPRLSMQSAWSLISSATKSAEINQRAEFRLSSIRANTLPSALRAKTLSPPNTYCKR